MNLDSYLNFLFEDDEIDEQFNIIQAMKDPKIMAAAKSLAIKTGIGLRAAVVKVSRFGGATGAIV